MAYDDIPVGWGDEAMMREYINNHNMTAEVAQEYAENWSNPFRPFDPDELNDASAWLWAVFCTARQVMEKHVPREKYDEFVKTCEVF